MTYAKLQLLSTVAIILGVLAGCSDAEDTDTDTDTDTGDSITYDVVNQGYACLVDDGNDDTSTGTIEVVLADCLSGCADSLSASCEAEVVDQSIEVTASGEYSLPTGDAACPAVCIELVATCPVTDIADDTWTMTYAGKSTEIDFPASDKTCTDTSG